MGPCVCGFAFEQHIRWLPVGGGAGDGGASDSGRVAVAAMEVGMSVAVRVTINRSCGGA